MQHNKHIKALYELSAKAGEVEQMLSALAKFHHELNANTIQYLDSPMVATQDKTQVIKHLGAPKITEAFLIMWIKERRLNQFDLFYKQLTQFIQTLNKQVVVDVLTAHAISDAYKETLKQELKTFLQANEVLLNIHLDARIIGGIKLQYEGKALDYSVVNTLDHMKNNL